QIFFLILKEAFFLGIIGTSAGILLGLLIGQELLQRVSATMDTIYFSVDAKTLFVNPWQIGKAAALGLSATFLAVLPPAWEATRLSPIAAMSRSQLETGVRHLIKSANLFGIILIMTGIGVAFFSSTSITLGLSSIFLLLIGFALLTPSLTSVIMTGIERLSARILGILGKLPPRMVNAEISRTSIAIAALMIVVAATIGMELMIDSFRQTVSQWLKITLQADFYVAVSNDKQALDKAQADRQLKSRITELPGVTMVSSVLHTRVMGDRESIPVSVFELNERSKRGFILNKDKFPDIWRLFEQQQSIIVTEAYAYHRQVSPGATLRLKTDQGLQDFTVLAVYKDYSGDQGHIAMSRRQYLRFWPDLGYSGIGVYAQQDTDVNRLEQRLRAMLKNTQMLRSNADIYTASMQIFEQTFKVTETLRWLAAGIAFVGIFGALMALQFERTRQLGILRAIGITPEQITLLITAETGLMGLVAGLLAIPAGLIVAYMLIFVVYPRSFGWTMAFHMNPVALMQGLLLAFGAALVAGIIPGRKMAQSSPARALRSE
ncbi:MAG: FtsX-like permease family protein, partial [Gammaproteobacteria bacterium]